MFIGTFNCNVDNKGRLMLPVKFRELLEKEPFFITKGFDNQLIIYPSYKWEKFIEKLESYDELNEDADDILRYFLGNAFEGEFDKQGRININSLKLHANIDKKATIIGMNDKIEIWSSDNYSERILNSESIKLKVKNLLRNK